MFGLDDKEIAMIQDVLCRYPEVVGVNVYGSRALGSFRHNSDIDLVLIGEIDRRTQGIIMASLDELGLPYIFDVCVYGDIDHAPFKEHIDTYGKPFPLTF